MKVVRPRSGSRFTSVHIRYRGTSLIRNSAPLGPYSRTAQGPMAVLGGGGAVSHERGTPVHANEAEPRKLSKDSSRVKWVCSWSHFVGICRQQPPPQGPPQVPRQRVTLGSYGLGVSYEQGTPADLKALNPVPRQRGGRGWSIQRNGTICLLMRRYTFCKVNLRAIRRWAPYE